MVGQICGFAWIARWYIHVKHSKWSMIGEGKEDEGGTVTVERRVEKFRAIIKFSPTPSSNGE